jgi:signal transduction histidine kinase
MTGVLACLLALFRDISERRKAEEALERDRRTLEHLFRSTDHERRLIAYEIHDGLAQLLAGAIMQFDTFAHLKEKKSKEAQRVFDAAILMLRQSHAEARRLISGVRPPILDEAGIVTAISHLIHEQREPNGPQIEYHADVSFDRLVPIQENTIYRIVQEALTNAFKYSQSEKIRVQIAQRGEDVWIEVQDWGIGFRQDQIGEQCFGLHGIRERTRLLGGKTKIETAPGRGTRVLVEMPFVVREKETGGF